MRKILNLALGLLLAAVLPALGGGRHGSHGAFAPADVK
jgi:hypothetical protein